MERQDVMSLTAIRLYGLPNSWAWAKAEAVHGGTLLEGNTVTINKNGKKVWTKPFQKMVITRDQMVETEKLWELENGKCFKCLGTGRELFGHNIETGPKYRPCTKCKAQP